MRKIAATGGILLEESNPVNLDVYTRVPTKYLLIDTETNQIYQGNSGRFSWRKLNVDPEDINSFILDIVEKVE